MILYDLMKNYALHAGLPPAVETLHPELGQSLALFHSCLIEAGMDHQEREDDSHRLTASPLDILPNHLSRFVVGFLPFNSVATKEETNAVLFDVYSFLRWLEKRDISHGLENMDYQTMVRELTQAQERCLQLSHFLDEETLRILDDPPAIVNTINEIFKVARIEGNYINLESEFHSDPIRIHLPDEIINLVRLNDYLDLVLGDTSEKWVILEAGQVFPEGDTNPRPSTRN